MRARNNAGKRLLALQRGIALFCILILFVFIGLLFSVSPRTYAHSVYTSIGNVAARRKRTPIPLPTLTFILPTPTTPIFPTPTNTPIFPTPTNTPIFPTPTDTPILPTPTNTPIPTATTAPTNTPTVRATPTVVVKPTSTSAAGILPPNATPGGTLPKTTPTPTPPILTVTGTPSRAGLPPGTTNVVSSPTVGTNTTYGSAAITTQDNGKALLPTAPELVIGSSVLAAAALLGWYVWRRRQGNLLSAAYPLAQTPQSNIASPMPYDQTIQARGTIPIVQEQRPRYQPDIMNEMVPETPVPLQALMSNADMSLETIMRQAQMGLFALPNQEEYS